MANDLTGIWVGESGSEYLYHAYGLNVSLPSRMGNYIYAKKNHEGLWVPVYMGEGDLAVCCAAAELLECIRSRAATHLHLRINRREEDRHAELGDLLGRYQNAFHPDGCHSEKDRRPSRDDD